MAGNKLQTPAIISNGFSNKQRQTETSRSCIVHGCSEADYKSGGFIDSDWAMTQTASLWVCGKAEDNKTARSRI